MKVGKVASAAAGYADFLGGRFRMIYNQNTPRAFSSLNCAHQASSAAAQYEDVIIRYVSHVTSLRRHSQKSDNMLEQKWL
jgi:hypothetical protein